MTFFLGIDRSAYPGDDTMKRLRQEAKVSWTGFYLAPAPSHPGTGWMSKRSFLKGLGYGFAPLYVGQQQEGPGSHDLSFDQGHLDADDAVHLASNAGFPDSTVIYLDIENGPPAKAALQQYYQGWVQRVRERGYTPGVYCSHLLAKKFKQLDSNVVFWIFHLKFNSGHSFSLPIAETDPASSDFTDADLMQYAQNAKIVLSNSSLQPVDLDTSLSADPSTITL